MQKWDILLYMLVSLKVITKNEALNTFWAMKKYEIRSKGGILK